MDEAYLWPDALSREQVTEASNSEVVAIYPHRSDVPDEVWEQLFSAAEQEIGILVYAGIFLAEEAAVQKILAAKARAGVRVRVLLADPDSPQVAERAADEGVGESMAARVRNALVLFRRCGPPAARSSGSTRPPCTTRSSAATTRCWSIPTSTAWPVPMPRRGTCAGWPEARSSAPTWTASRRSGNPRSQSWSSAVMASRIDYYHDPDAPAATTMVPSANTVVVNDAGEILLVRRSDNGNWALPGGAVELGETLAQAAVRETREESGVECEITGVSGIYTDPRHVILYTSNGEVRQECSIVLTARATGGHPTPSTETSEVRWVPLSEVGGYQMDPSMRLRVQHYAERRDRPYLG